MNAQAQFSECGPSRASFLTSLRPDKLKIYNLRPNSLVDAIIASKRRKRRGIETLPGWFLANGYYTYGAGKVFHENEYSLYYNPGQWTEPVYTWMNLGKRPPSFVQPYTGSWANFPDVDDLFFSDGQMANLSASLITDKLAYLDKPWLFAVGFYKPQYVSSLVFISSEITDMCHSLPFQAPKRYIDMSSNDTAPEAGNPNIINFSPSWLTVARGDLCQEVNLYSGVPPPPGLYWKSPSTTQRNAARSYRATVAYFDEQMGKLLQALSDSNQLMDTHIILLGDHGFHLGDKVSLTLCAEVRADSSSVA